MSQGLIVGHRKETCRTEEICQRRLLFPTVLYGNVFAEDCKVSPLPSAQPVFRADGLVCLDWRFLLLWARIDQRSTLV